MELRDERRPRGCDEDGAFGCVLEEIKGGCGERENDRVDFPAVCGEDGGKQVLLVARTEERDAKATDGEEKGGKESRRKAERKQQGDRGRRGCEEDGFGVVWIREGECGWKCSATARLQRELGHGKPYEKEEEKAALVLSWIGLYV